MKLYYQIGNWAFAASTLLIGILAVVKRRLPQGKSGNIPALEGETAVVLGSVLIGLGIWMLAILIKKQVRSSSNVHSENKNA